MKEIYDGIRNGYPYKLIIVSEVDSGAILQVMEKPNYKLADSSTLFSGAHVFSKTPEQNHYDYYENGERWIERGDNLSFPFELSGSRVILN